MLKKLRNKKMYITPYNNIAIRFKQYLYQNDIYIKGIIDTYKEGKGIVKKSDIKDYDFIIIMSPNHFKEISRNYIQSRVIYANLVIDKYILTFIQEEYIHNLQKEAKINDDKSLYKFNVEGYTYYTFTNLNNMIINTLKNYKFLLSDYSINIDKNDTVIDIGAHHGLVSIYCASLGATVYSYEPNPDNFNILKKNTNSNPFLKLNIYNNAVSNTTETLELCCGHSSTTGSLKHLEFDQYTLDKTISNSVLVTCVTLKDILTKFSSIKLLKIDCEGCEYESFLTLNKELLKNVQYILLEAHTTKDFNPKDMEDILDKFGFEFITYSSGDKYKEYICKNLFWRKK